MNLIIDYINNSATSEEVEDIQALIIKCKHHALLPLLYKACKAYKQPLTEEQEKFLKKEFFLSVSKETVQEYELGEIINALNDNKIKCMMMKGSIIKHLYKSPEERSMCDLDILYDEKEAKKVKKILLSMGYTCKSYGGTHDIYYKAPYMNVEMHRVVIDENQNIYYDYYKNIWDVVKQVEGKEYVYKMSDEDFYIHMIVHAARHFAKGGIGLRYLIDEWIYLNKKELDFDYINSELKKIKLDVFQKNFSSLAFTLFKKEPLSEYQKQLLDYIITSGTHGVVTHSQAVKMTLGKEVLKATNRNVIAYYFRALFPTFKQMKVRNHILKKVPILLPYFYLERIFNAIFKRRSLTVAMIKGVKEFNAEKAKEIRELHEKTGA